MVTQRAFVSIKEIKPIINNFPKQKTTGGFTCEFYQMFNNEIMKILYNVFQKIDIEGILPNLSVMNIDGKILNKILANRTLENQLM